MLSFQTNFIKFFAYLATFAVLLSWTACEDDMPPPSGCVDDVPKVIFNDIVCEADVLTFDNLADEQAGSLPDIPDFCATDYGLSRVARLSNFNEVSALAVYVNFPAPVVVEIIAADCQGGIPELIECHTIDAVAEVIDLNPSDFAGIEDVLVRMVVPGGSNYPVGEDEDDAISFAAIQDIGSPEYYAEQGLIACSGDRLQRLIISDPQGLGAVGALGLPISKSCGCSDGVLVSVDVPYGIDLQTLRPKAKERKSRALTGDELVGIDFDWLIATPGTSQLSGYDSNDDNFLQEEGIAECLGFRISPDLVSPQNPESGITVAFIDSGFDIDGWGSVAEQVGYQGATPICWESQGLSMSGYGYDMVNNDDLPDDQDGHGTQVATALLSNLVGEQLSVLHFKFMENGQGSLFDALCGSYLATAAGADILNWSWGFRDDEKPRSVENLLAYLMDKGCLVVAAAGNFGAQMSIEPLYPALLAADYENLISVTSYAYLNYPSLEPELPAFANRNAPFVSVAAYAGTETADLGGGLARPIGTSISAPLMGRQLAEYWAEDPTRHYSFVSSEILASLPNAGSLAGEVVDSRYLPFGCIDEELPAP